MMREGSCGNSQNLRNFPHASTGGWVSGHITLVGFACLSRVLTSRVGSGPQCSVVSTRFSHPPTLRSMSEPSGSVRLFT